MSDWYERNGCDHAHCPAGCQHPQEMLLADGRMVCGRCAFVFGELVLVEPCVPGVCDE